MKSLIARLASFADGMIQAAFDGYDVEGSEITDMALACGLIVETTYSYERHGEHESLPNEGAPWFELSDGLKAALRDGGE